MADHVVLPCRRLIFKKTEFSAISLAGYKVFPPVSVSFCRFGFIAEVEMNSAKI
jgi:hypothetical protein